MFNRKCMGKILFSNFICQETIMYVYYDFEGINLACFGEILVESRKDRHLTQHQLAKILYVTDGTISNYENGIHFPDIEKLCEIADFFGVTTDYLLGRCKANMSVDIFAEPLSPQLSVGDTVNQIRGLTPGRKQILLAILDDMYFCSLVGGHGNKVKK